MMSLSGLARGQPQLRRGRDGAGLRVSNGWRRELVGNELVELVAGRLQLSVGPDGRLEVTTTAEA